QRIGKDQTTVSKEVKRHLVSQALEHRAFDREMIEDIYAEKFKNDREDGAPPIPSRAAFAMNAAACLRALARWLFGRIVIVWGFSGEPK
ncbi:MAG: hypothetical protein FWC27_05380, partial [Firmicutes bacterium]|nr:hypothetical protein [Bacillota bacterium]